MRYTIMSIEISTELKKKQFKMVLSGNNYCKNVKKIKKIVKIA